MAHDERIWTQFLEAEGIPVLAWAARSPDNSTTFRLFFFIIVGSLRLTCAILLSDLYLDMPDLGFGWIILTKENNL